MSHPSGNIDRERAIDIFLKGVTLQKLAKKFAKIGDYIKPVPTIGRPKKSNQKRLEDKLKAERKKGILNIFKS